MLFVVDDRAALVHCETAAAELTPSLCVWKLERQAWLHQQVPLAASQTGKTTRFPTPAHAMKPKRHSERQRSML
jgi:hypothetical protein